MSPALERPFSQNLCYKKVYNLSIKKIFFTKNEGLNMHHDESEEENRAIEDLLTIIKTTVLALRESIRTNSSSLKNIEKLLNDKSNNTIKLLDQILEIGHDETVKIQRIMAH